MTRVAVSYADPSFAVTVDIPELASVSSADFYWWPDVK